MNNTAKKIVIFDDDEDILSICTYILEEEGWVDIPDALTM